MADQKIMKVVPRLNLTAGDKGGPEGDGITPKDVDIQTTAGEANPADQRDPATFKGSAEAEGESELSLSSEVGAEATVTFASEKQRKDVLAALKVLDEAGVGRINIAGGKARFYTVPDPEKTDYAAAKRQVEQSYKGNLSDNRAFFFNVDVPSSLRVAAERGAAEVTIPMTTLAGIIRNATEIGSRNAVNYMFERLAAAGYEVRKVAAKAGEGLAQDFGKDGKTDIQKKIETSHDPAKESTVAMDFDEIDAEGQLKALESVSQLPFDFVDPDPITNRGRKAPASREPAKIAGRKGNR